jgi:excisionase family DNA binding protein
VPDNSTTLESFADFMANSLSVGEACAISGFTPGWIRQLLIRGDVIGRKVGRDWRISKASFQEYLDKERRPGPKTE